MGRLIDESLKAIEQRDKIALKNAESGKNGSCTKDVSRTSRIALPLQTTKDYSTKPNSVKTLSRTSRTTNSTESTDSTNSPILLNTNIHNWNVLSTKNKILACFYGNSLCVDSVAKHLDIEKKNIHGHITRSNQKDGLLDLDLIEFTEEIERVKYYTATNKGKGIIDDIVKEQKHTKEMRELEEKSEDVLTTCYNQVKEYAYKHEDVFLEAIRLNKPVYVSYLDLVKECYLQNGITELLMTKPKDAINLFQAGISNVFDLCPTICFINFPKSCLIPIGEIRAKDSDKFMTVKGVPVGVTGVMPRVHTTKFECRSCAMIINVLQKDKRYKTPKKCACGCKKFIVLKEELKDIQILKLEELSEEMGKRTTPKKITVVIEGQLTGINIQPHLEESKTLIINGILETESVMVGFMKQTTKTYYLQANSIELETKEEQDITPHDIEKIKEFAKQNDVKKIIVDNFAEEIVNRNLEKEALLLSALSGGNKVSKPRDDSHLLLLGDPSIGKSFLLDKLRDLIPNTRWVSSNTTSGVGLIGTVRKDEQLGETILSKGALPMANGSIVLCDELDKMRFEDRLALHEPLENQEVHIDKWDKHGSFKTDCTFIATMNPKYSRFVEDYPVIDQINLPASLLSRFDIILVMKDNPEKEGDKKVVNAIFGQYKKVKRVKVEKEFLTKYLKYARRLEPEYTDEIQEYISDFYVKIRQRQSMGVSFTARQLQGIFRLSRANAKLRLSLKVELEDVKSAIHIIHSSLKQIATDDLTGEIDVDSVFGSYSASERKIIGMIKMESKGIDIENLFSRLNVPRENFDKLIERLKKRGDVLIHRSKIIANK